LAIHDGAIIMQKVFYYLSMNSYYGILKKHSINRVVSILEI